MAIVTMKVNICSRAWHSPAAVPLQHKSRVSLLGSNPKPRSWNCSSEERYWSCSLLPAQMAFSEIPTTATWFLVSYRNALLHVFLGMLSSKGYCGRSLTSPRSQKMEVILQTCLLLTEFLTQTLPRLSRPHASPDTPIPAGACRGRMLFKAGSKKL